MKEDENLEQGDDPAEQADKVSGKEPEEQVSKGKVAVSGEKSEEDIATETKAAADTLAVEAYKKSDAYEKAVQSQADKSIHSQTKPLRDEIAGLKKFNAEAELTAKEAKEAEKWKEEGISEEAIKSFQAERREAERVSSALQAALDKHGPGFLKLRAYELSQETGVEMKALLGCKTPEEMDKKAVELVAKAKDDKIVSLEADKKAAGEEAAKKQKIDSGAPGAAGVDLSGLSADDKLKQGFADLKK